MSSTPVTSVTLAIPVIPTSKSSVPAFQSSNPMNPTNDGAAMWSPSATNNASNGNNNSGGGATPNRNQW